MLDTANSVNRDRELIIDEICDELRKGVSHAHDKMIKAHMQGKIEATSADQFGSPLIVSASQGGMKDAVQHLLARNSDINQADGDGSTALHYAVLFNRHQVIQLLLDNNADTEVVNNQGCKPGQMSLHSIYENAFECCRRQVTDTLVRYLSMDWIPPNLTENEWKMNLTDKKVLRTEIIVENGRKTFRCEELEVSSPTENMLEYYTGKTILMFAAEFGMFNVVKVLLKLRADPALKDTTDKDALTLSIENKHFEIAHYINNRLPEGLRQEILDEETKELNDLKILFKHFCTLGTKDLGVQAARTGRSTSRRSTMDFNEYLTFFNEEKPLRETSVGPRSV
uniref:Uncharacterized protein n=1 Tax=Guillardia theta TaxID=55529 RepID=A0A7S4NS36_GUITH|mmetsp:Transcript_30002/g.96203  ORF Transcript_30002/g.96203 Transcript_30002/m.96203 type:complete len:339 (+) Transcript_30002:288-1304(+)